MSLIRTLTSHPAAPVDARHAALLLRVALGAILLAHGLLKLVVFGTAGTVGFFESLGFAGWLAYLVIAFEIVAGALLLLGLYVRPVALLSVLLLAVTVFVHAGNGFLFSAPNGGWEYPLYLIVTALAVALLGEGAYALRRQRPTPAAPVAGQA